MVASPTEYRYRFSMILLVYMAAYAFYNLDHLNVLYALVPWNRGAGERDLLVRLLYGAAAMLAALGAMVLTWASAWRPPGDAALGTAFSIGGPFRYVRNPHYISYFLLLVALGTFQSRTGFLVMLAGEMVLLWRLVGREEMRLAAEYGERFRAYAKCVPRFWPIWRPGIAADGSRPQWPQAVWQNAFQWGFVLTLLAFAVTLSDPIGYLFGGVTLVFLAAQMMVEALFLRRRKFS